jgi:hypothetical protein
MPAPKKSLKGIRKRPKMRGPQTDKEKLFCERWLIHFDKDRAYREAGYIQRGRGSGAGHLASAMLERFADYLRPIREAKAKIVAERIFVDSEKVLEKMVAQGFYDPSGFYEKSTEPLTEWVEEDGGKEMVERVVMWDGKPVYGERMKPYSDLTPAQQAVVEITRVDERIQYRLPTISERHTNLAALGRQFGMFAEKLIVERHNHQHTHQTLTFENVSTLKLQTLTQQLLPMVGLEFAQTLGFTAEDIETASREEGVLMPAKATG